MLQELAERDGLVDVVLRPRSQLPVLLESLVARLARHDDERDVLERSVLLQLVADGEAVHPRQFDGEQNEIGALRGCLLQADATVVHHAGAAAELSELVPELASERSVALENENLDGHGPS